MLILSSNCSKHSRKRSSIRFLIAVAISSVITAPSACSFSHKPSRVVEDLVRAVERGDIEKAMTFFSSSFVSRQGIEQVKQGLSQASLQLKEHGGVKSLNIVKENVAGEVAEVTLAVTRGNGGSATVLYRLTKEQGTWKIDAIADVTSSAIDALQPERAVQDVVKWAREQGVSDIQNWLAKQPKPPVCNAPSVDRNTLPDEVRYHDVDDPRVRERLFSALEPVLKLVRCENSQGVILYKGQTVYAGNLQGGQIAITPGALYFGASPPDERIFHNLAELRIFLAREIFRQMIVVETPPEGLNQADVMLRRELKLNYLAGVVSLTIDKDPTILDRVALDIDLYGKPPGVPSGTQSMPDLRQIQDIFGAAKQDYKQ